VGLAGTHRLGASYARPQSGANPETISSRVSLVLERSDTATSNPRKRRSSARRGSEIRELRNAEEGARLRATRNYLVAILVGEPHQRETLPNAVHDLARLDRGARSCGVARVNERSIEGSEGTEGTNESEDHRNRPVCRLVSGSSTRVQPLSFLSRIAVEVAVEVAVEAE